MHGSFASQIISPSHTGQPMAGPCISNHITRVQTNRDTASPPTKNFERDKVAVNCSSLRQQPNRERRTCWLCPQALPFPHACTHPLPCVNPFYNTYFTNAVPSSALPFPMLHQSSDVCAPILQRLQERCPIIRRRVWYSRCVRCVVNSCGTRRQGSAGSLVGHAITPPGHAASPTLWKRHTGGKQMRDLRLDELSQTRGTLLPLLHHSPKRNWEELSHLTSKA